MQMIEQLTSEVYLLWLSECIKSLPELRVREKNKPTNEPYTLCREVVNLQQDNK